MLVNMDAQGRVEGKLVCHFQPSFFNLRFSKYLSFNRRILNQKSWFCIHNMVAKC